MAGDDTRFSLQSHVYPQPRNLKVADLVDGGLVGGDITYNVTHKADGVRRLLVVAPNGLWFFYPPGVLNKLLDRSSFTSAMEAQIGTILDGELIPSANRYRSAPTTEYYYLVFDCPTKPSRYYRELPEKYNAYHQKRMELARQVGEKLSSDLLTVHAKTFLAFTTTSEFFDNMAEMYRQQQQGLAFATDGVLFTPTNADYFPEGQTHPLPERVTTMYADVIKWKPATQQTIDFTISREQGQIRLYAWNPKNKMHENFQGTTSAPYKGYLSTFYDDDTLPNRSIFEMQWTGEDFFPLRQRSEKPVANSFPVAIDVWKNIQDPITWETLRGQSLPDTEGAGRERSSLYLMRKYHNRVKNDLFRSSSGVLLDIGSGRGGDIGKWQNYDAVLAVEPNEEHIQELRQRLSRSFMQHRVTVLQAGGEETKKIVDKVRAMTDGKGVDTVSLMLSLSFFSREGLAKVLDTVSKSLKANGKILVLSVDGRSVEQFFSPPKLSKYSLAPRYQEVNLGTAYLRANLEENKLFISIAGTIVEDQEEYLVDLGAFLSGLRARGRKMEYSLSRCDKQGFLSPAGRTLSSFYTSLFIECTPRDLLCPLSKGKQKLRTSWTGKDIYRLKYGPSFLRAFLYAVFPSKASSQLVSRVAKQLFGEDRPVKSKEDVSLVAKKLGVNIVLVSATAVDVVDYRSFEPAPVDGNFVFLLNNFPSAPLGQGNFEVLAQRNKRAKNPRRASGESQQGKSITYQTTFPPNSEITTSLLGNAPSGHSQTSS